MIYLLIIIVAAFLYIRPWYDDKNGILWYSWRGERRYYKI